MRFRVVLIPFVAASVAKCASVTSVDPQSFRDVTNKVPAARDLRAQFGPNSEERADPVVTAPVVEGVGRLISSTNHDQSRLVDIAIHANEQSHPVSVPQSAGTHIHVYPTAPEGHRVQPNVAEDSHRRGKDVKTESGEKISGPPALTLEEIKSLTPEQLKKIGLQVAKAPKTVSGLRKTFYWLAGIFGVTGAAVLLFKLWQNHHAPPPESTAAAGTVPPAAGSSSV